VAVRADTDDYQFGAFIRRETGHRVDQHIKPFLWH
jgi:hypothetical protein